MPPIQRCRTLHWCVAVIFPVSREQRGKGWQEVRHLWGHINKDTTSDLPRLFWSINIFDKKKGDMKKMTTASPRNPPHRIIRGNGDRLTPIQEEGISIKVEDKLMRRKDGELTQEGVATIEENTDLPNRNYRGGCYFFHWLIGWGWLMVAFDCEAVF